MYVGVSARVFNMPCAGRKEGLTHILDAIPDTQFCARVIVFDLEDGSGLFEGVRIHMTCREDASSIS